MCRLISLVIYFLSFLNIVFSFFFLFSRLPKQRRININIKNIYPFQFGNFIILHSVFRVFSYNIHMLLVRYGRSGHRCFTKQENIMRNKSVMWHRLNCVSMNRIFIDWSILSEIVFTSLNPIFYPAQKQLCSCSPSVVIAHTVAV